MDRVARYAVFAGAVFFGVLISAYASGTDSSSWSSPEQENKPAVSLYDQGVKANNNAEYSKALSLFEEALKQDNNNPDILNMMAHAQLKLGMIDQSLENYRRALSLRPRFPEAREYLGEAYLQAALREIETLKSYGGDGDEAEEDLKKAFKESAAKLGE